MSTLVLLSGRIANLPHFGGTRLITRRSESSEVD
jgi:hypothetical protein